MAARGSLTIIFPEQVQSVNTSSISSTSSVTTSGKSITTTTEDGQTYSITCVLADGYKIGSVDFSQSINGGSIGSFTDSTINIMAGAGGIDGTLTITAAQSTIKAVSSDNLARFKQKCDETYAAIGNIPAVSTELVNLGTLSTSGTLTADQATQIGTTTVGVTARASVNSVTRFYERVNISGTTAMLISADDDALHVLTVNLSTRAYTLSDVALGSGPEIPTPTTSDNGKILGVTNGEYALLNLFPVGSYYITESATTPASLFGGEWVQVKGKFLLGASVQDGYPLGTEGGEKTHTLTTEEMPEHYHQLGSKPNTGNIVAAGPYSADGGGYNNNFESYIDSTWAGGNQPHNNMPPYRIVNIWRRTA